MAFFSKSSSSDDADQSVGAKRSARKAESFFRHAETVADAHNYDYAIECYINGLKHDPGNMGKHEALYEVAKRRKVSGGKPAGLGEKLKSGGKVVLDKMLHTEKLWAMDPINVKLMRDMMEHAVEADQVEGEEANLAEVAFWVGNLALDLNAQTKNDKTVYLALRDLFSQIGRYDKAVEACKRALRQDPNNSKLLADLKDLEAENMMAQGSYGDGEKGDFRSNLKDADSQTDIQQSQAISSTQSALDEQVQRRRAEYEEDPEDLDRLQKLVDALVRKETNDAEKEAIELLNKAWDQSGQYRYKVKAGDITMRQINRYVRQLQKQLQAAPDDEQAKQKLTETLRKKLKFELQEYQERVKNYPTDLSLKYQLGLRLFQSEQYDQAIGMFQQAKQDPKSRSSAYLYLGRCYMHKDWQDEAIDTLREGIENHENPGDKVALELRYRLMEALEQSAAGENDPAKAKEAQKIASQILQTDINYRDIKQRVEKLKGLTDQLQSSSS